MLWTRARSPPRASTSSSASRSDDDRLRRHPNILFTPHTAFYSVEGYDEMRTKTAQEIRRILLCEAPRNPVNVLPGTRG